MHAGPIRRQERLVGRVPKDLLNEPVATAGGVDGIHQALAHQLPQRRTGIGLTDSLQRGDLESAAQRRRDAQQAPYGRLETIELRSDRPFERGW